jgi:acyl-lipid omega-6 desaturase (Delta-12 desaturase)
MLSDQARAAARIGKAQAPAIALAGFRCDTRRSSIQLLITGAGFASIWLIMWLCRDQGYWITLLLAFPAGGFLLRLFAIQHDCGHGSFFESRGLNDFVGRTLGVFTLTPYKYWRRLHATHHANSGNLDRRGIGDIEMLTVAEYRGLSRMRQIVYRLYRHPAVLLGIGPLYLFIFKHRLPFDLPLTQGQAWQSVLGTNLAICLLAAGMMWLVGPGDFIRIQLPPVVLASVAGVWLFFVQHQFEAAYWRREKNWNFRQAALHGSSYYRLPKLLQWMSASIGLHHVHHLSSRIPNYRLQEVLDQSPQLKAVRPLTLRQSLACITLSLWDEGAGKMIRFHDLSSLPH